MKHDEIAHQATNEVYSISMGLQVLLSDLPQELLSTKQQDTIRYMKLSSERLIDLIEKLTNEEAVA